MGYAAPLKKNLAKRCRCGRIANRFSVIRGDRAVGNLEMALDNIRQWGQRMQGNVLVDLLACQKVGFNVKCCIEIQGLAVFVLVSILSQDEPLVGVRLLLNIMPIACFMTVTFPVAIKFCCVFVPGTKLFS